MTRRGNPPAASVPDEISAALAQHLPRLRLRSVVELGSGLDNVAYDVNGELVVRRRRDPDQVRQSTGVRREAALLTAVAAWSTLPVPEVVFVDEITGVIAHRLLPGRPLLDRPDVDPARLAPALGSFLSRLHLVPLEELAGLVDHDDAPPQAWLEETRVAYREIASYVAAADQSRIEDFLAAPPPPESPAVAFCHNDLGAEHLLVGGEPASVTGVIDWTDAALADPAHDLARPYRDLGPAAFEVMLAHYDRQLDPATLARTRFFARCALVEDLAYGLREGDLRYSDAASKRLSAIFA
ncbi:MAG TPA: aminoglycoside phosphotransferase family protein [Jiangellaceae bacterium]